MVKIKQMFCVSDITDTSINLAVEEYFMNICKEDTIILFLWQSHNTVVIGQHQNPYRECNLQLMEEEQVTLIRRKSGGGAVYHDIGNLNFSFIVPKSLYDIEKQFEVIVEALNSLGIKADVSGRNDMTVDGCKFSGNAFIHHDEVSCHHGTLLVETALEKLGKYLTPSSLKLRSKGVESVRARVINLKQYKTNLTVARVIDAIQNAFEATYEGQVENIELPASKDVEMFSACYSDWSWTYGASPKYDISYEDRFEWGNIGIELSIHSGKITNCDVHSDTLIDDHFKELAKEWIGLEFRKEYMLVAVKSVMTNDMIKKNICDLLEVNII